MPSYPGVEEYRRQTGAVRPLMPNIQSSSINEGVQAFAGALRDVGQAEDRIKESDAAVSANADLMNSRAFWAEQIQQRKDAAPAGADGFTGTVLTDFDKDAQERVKRAKTKAAAQDLNNRLSAVRLGLQQDAMQFEAGERIRHRSSQLDDAALNANKAAKANPADFLEIAAAQKQAIDASGLDAATRDEKWRLSKKGIAESAVVSMIQNDPRAAYKELTTDSELMSVNALTDKARADLAAHAKKQIYASDVNAITSQYANDVIRGDQALAAMRKRTDLSDDDKDRIAKDVQTQINELRSERKRTHLDDMVNTEATIAADLADDTTYAKAAELYRNGALSPDEYSGMVSRIASSVTKKKKDDNSLVTLQEAFNAGLPVSPHWPEQMKALNGAFKASVKTEPVGSPLWQSVAKTYAKTYRALPDRVSDWLNQTSRASDPKIASMGARFYGSMTADTPDTESNISTDTKAMLGIMNSMFEAGSTDERLVVDTARDLVLNANDQVKQERKKQYSQTVDQSPPLRKGNSGALNDFISNDFDTATSWQPATGVILPPIFDKQTELYFMKHGDIDVARKQAWTDMKRNIGVTGLYKGGTEMTLMPVEKYGVTPDYVRAELDEALKKEPGLGLSVDDVRLLPDEMSLRTVIDSKSGKVSLPSYYLQDKFGNNIWINGKRAKYQIPESKELERITKDAKAKEDADSKAEVEKAKAMRDEMIKHREEVDASQKAWKENAMKLEY